MTNVDLDAVSMAEFVNFLKGNTTVQELWLVYSYLYFNIVPPPPHTGLQNTMGYSETKNLSCGQNVSLKVYWSHGNNNGRLKINIEIHLISQQSKQEQGRIQDFGKGGSG